LITPALHNNEKILLIDDEVAVRNLYQISLEKHGLTVFTASGVREALQALHDLKFDVVVVDLHLADGDGMDIVRHIKGDSDGPKVLAMSGYHQTDHASEELKRRGVPLFNKLEPITELVRLISLL
jgi:DNA-binding NtrC family response regulator